MDPSEGRDLNSTLNGKNRAPTMTKPFDVLAEGLPKGKSRGDWTPLELFVAGVQGWEAGLRRFFDKLSDEK
jgi:hypothetical protein